MMMLVNHFDAGLPSSHGAAAPAQEAAQGAGSQEAGTQLLEQVRAELAGLELPLALPGAAGDNALAAAALGQLEDYILPRWRSLDAPLLAVVGGSTGAGKSTLVNALAGHPVTRS